MDEARRCRAQGGSLQCRYKEQRGLHTEEPAGRAALCQLGLLPGRCALLAAPAMLTCGASGSRDRLHMAQQQQRHMYSCCSTVCTPVCIASLPDTALAGSPSAQRAAAAVSERQGSTAASVCQQTQQLLIDAPNQGHLRLGVYVHCQVDAASPAQPLHAARSDPVLGVVLTEPG